MSLTITTRCNQNKLFGCGKLAKLPAVTYVIGVDRVRIQAGGFCKCCLPLAVVRDANETEKTYHYASKEDER